MENVLDLEHAKLTSERDRLKTINAELVGFAEMVVRLTPDEGLSSNALWHLRDMAERLLAKARNA